MAINGILEELGNGVDGSLFADDQAIYISTRSQSPTGIDQEAVYIGNREGLNIFSHQEDENEKVHTIAIGNTSSN